MDKLNGLIAAAFTPSKYGEIDLDVVSEYARFLSANGIAGVFVNGTTGEGQSLTLEERLDLAEAWIKAAPSNLKVIVHVGHNSLKACCTMTRHAAKLGAWAVSAIGPCYFKPTLKELVEFTAEIARAAPRTPFYYYHIPSITGLTHRMIDYLEEAGSRIPNLAGIKFTSEDLMDYGLCVNHANQRYDMVFGRDEILLCGVAVGARAAIGSTYNFAAPLYLDILRAFKSGDMATAGFRQKVSMELVAACMRVSPLVLPAIRVLTEWRSGMDLGVMRAPISPPPEKPLLRLKQEAEALAGPYLSTPEVSAPPMIIEANGQLKEP